MIKDPPIIFADEPTGNLDSKNGIATMKAFDNLVEEGKTVILITHDSQVADMPTDNYNSRREDCFG
ncbi:MAG: hypothetical protein CM1200mP16_01830 [Nitrospina sp.]|nr:MAG: hypothetical protein CM1200mP16_01830 [Nitrospina sp.]